MATPHEKCALLECFFFAHKTTKLTLREGFYDAKEDTFQRDIGGYADYRRR